MQDGAGRCEQVKHWVTAGRSSTTEGSYIHAAALFLSEITPLAFCSIHPAINLHETFRCIAILKILATLFNLLKVS